MKYIKTFNETKSTLTKDQTDMYNGIVDILNMVKDVKNRREISEHIIKDFERENIEVDADNFLKDIGIYGESIDCDKCDWKWNIEIDDNRKHLCHKCGYDNELKKFDIISLNKWRIKNSK